MAVVELADCNRMWLSACDTHLCAGSASGRTCGQPLSLRSRVENSFSPHRGRQPCGWHAVHGGWLSFDPLFRVAMVCLLVCVPAHSWWQVFECMRRLLLTGLLVFVPDTSGQVAYGCIFAFIRCDCMNQLVRGVVAHETNTQLVSPELTMLRIFSANRAVHFVLTSHLGYTPSVFHAVTRPRAISFMSR